MKSCFTDVLRTFKTIMTVEDGVIEGGFGSAVLEFANDHGYHVSIRRLGVPDRFIDHGTPAGSLPGMRLRPGEHRQGGEDPHR